MRGSMSGVMWNMSRKGACHACVRRFMRLVRLALVTAQARGEGGICVFGLLVVPSGSVVVGGTAPCTAQAGGRGHQVTVLGGLRGRGVACVVQTRLQHPAQQHQQQTGSLAVGDVHAVAGSSRQPVDQPAVHRAQHAPVDNRCRPGSSLLGCIPGVCPSCCAALPAASSGACSCCAIGTYLPASAACPTAATSPPGHWCLPLLCAPLGTYLPASAASRTAATFSHSHWNL